jgi:hypothetical protein
MVLGRSFQLTGRKSYGHAVSLDEAKAAFRAEYVAWKSAPEPPRRTVTIPRAYRPVMINTKRHRGAFPAVAPGSAPKHRFRAPGFRGTLPVQPGGSEASLLAPLLNQSAAVLIVFLLAFAQAVASSRPSSPGRFQSVSASSDP